MSFARAAAEALPGTHRRVLLTDMAPWLADLQAGRHDCGSLAMLAGHFAYGVHRFLPGDPRTLTFLRHPLERTVSMHYESNKRPDIYPHGDLRELVSTSAGEPYFGNAQVRHLASENGRPVSGPLSRRHLARAKQVVIEELTCFGLTEYFAASLALIDHALGTRMTARHANASSRTSVQDLDPELLSLIWDANDLDRELYDGCRAVFFERVRTLTARLAPSAASAVSS